jgi:hypothetical protein
MVLSRRSPRFAGAIPQGGLACVLTAMAAASVGAQVPWPGFRQQWGALPEGQWETPQWQAPRQLQSPLSPRPGVRPGELGVQLYEGFQGFESVYPQYPSFPRYPSGYGPKPRLGGYLPTEPPEEPTAGWVDPGLPREVERGWPSWIKPGIPADALPPAAQRAVIARTADRVWVLTPDETAFTPLTFYEKFRLLESGSVIEVRNKGEFQISFHDGALLRSRGPVRLALPALTEEVGQLRLSALRRIWIYAKVRPFRLMLPDGSVLEFANTEVYLEESEARALVHNHGPDDVVWRDRIGDVTLKPGRRIDVFLVPPDHEFVAADLSVEGAVRQERTGRVLELRGDGSGGSVSWSGARIEVPGGAVVRLDPLAGVSFPEADQ